MAGENGQYVAGIDVGTTGVRCMLFDLDGRRVGGAYTEYGIDRASTGWVEQDVGEMLTQMFATCRGAIADAEVDPGRIASIGLSTQQCSTCVVDAEGDLVRPMISWQDTRALAQAQALGETIPLEDYVHITGIPASPQFLLPKMLWLREHEPDTVARMSKWALLHSLVLQALGVEDLVFDVSQAVFYGLWDIEANSWSERLLDAFGLHADSFGTPSDAAVQAGEVSERAARSSGFAVGTPVCVGAGDQSCGMVGMGVTVPGRVGITLGTAGLASITVPNPGARPAELLTLNHPIPGLWTVQGVTLAAGSAYGWFRDTFGGEEVARASRDGGDAFEHLNALAAQATAGCEGLVFLPYLNAGGTPDFNTSARAAFIGMTLAHGRAEFTRAVMEGVVYEMNEVLQTFSAHGLDAQTICLGGGPTKSPLWNQIQADVYGKPVDLQKESESTVLGAAILGAVGAGVFEHIEAGVTAMVHREATLQPDATRHALYSELFLAYQDAYAGLSERAYDRLSTLQTRV